MTRKRLNVGPARELKDLVDRIVALDIELKDAMADIKGQIVDVYEEAEGRGYDAKALKIAVRRRHESAAQRAKRQETEALADVYSAAIGDLFGKPLDDLTRRRLDEQMRRAQGDKEVSAEQNPELPTEATEPAAPPESPEQAREKGHLARREGLRVVDNPYHSASPLRAAWDEGWCEEDGSDGMEIPAAWRRAAEEKDEDGKPDDKKLDGDPPKPPSPPDGDQPQPQA